MRILEHHFKLRAENERLRGELELTRDTLRRRTAALHRLIWKNTTP